MAASECEISRTCTSVAMLGSSRSPGTTVRTILGCAILVGAALIVTPAIAQEASAPAVATAPSDTPAAPELPAAVPLADPVPNKFLQGSAALPSAEIEAWLANPTLNFPGNLGGSVINYVVRLAGSDSRAVLALIKLAEASEAPLPINQISRGLARSRNSASGVAIEYASFMDERVATSSSRRLIEAYQAALEENTAAINAGAVGAGPDGGGLSGNTNVGGGNGDGDGDGTVATGGFDTVLSANYSGIFLTDGSPAD